MIYWTPLTTDSHFTTKKTITTIQDGEKVMIFHSKQFFNSAIVK